MDITGCRQYFKMENKLRPCPYHGDPKAMEFSSASSEYAACIKCSGGEDSGPKQYRTVEGWNSAFVWKELDKAHATIRALREAIKILKKSLEHEIRCTACGFDECRKCYDCEAELALKQASSVLGEKE